jgi:electron transport complex protein RnfG
MSSPLASASRNAFILGLFALATASALGLTYALTRENIAQSQREVEARALQEVVQRVPHNNDILADSLPTPDDAKAILHVTDELIHVVRQNNEPVAFILPSVAPDGYSGAIHLLIGVQLNGEVSGVRVTAHRETPGLGDKVDVNKSDWITQFSGLSINNPPAADWAVRKDGGQFDAFTGATITPRAVVNQVRSTLEYFAAHRDQLVDMSDVQRLNTAEVND